MVDVDVLIVGGGAQGLWLLNDLTARGYKAIVLERDELGTGQTCHSHGLIHRGHYYDNVDMMIVLNAAAQFWQAFISRKGIEKLNPGRALAGFGPGTQVDRHTYFWKTGGLKFDRCAPFPDVLKGGKVRTLFETDEFSLDASEVISGLSGDLDHSIYKLDDSDDALKFDCDGTSIRTVEASLGGQAVQIAPRFVMLTAGVGNRKLLARLGADYNPGVERIPVQAQRKSHMMVLRGEGLPLMTAVFPIEGGLQGVFLCPRTDPESGKPVWLVSDHNSMPFEIARDGSTSPGPEPAPGWIERMLISLRAVAPAVLSDEMTQGLDVAVYTGLTSERNYGAGQHMTDCYIDPLGLENLLTIWPTKLTMTPFASNIAVRHIRAKVPEPGGVWPRIVRPIEAMGPAVAPEMWCRKELQSATQVKTPWLSYPEFVEKWKALPGGGAGEGAG